MGGGGPLSPDFPGAYKFFNTLKPHSVAAFAAFGFFFLATTIYDTSGTPVKRSLTAHTPKELQ